MKIVFDKPAQELMEPLYISEGAVRRAISSPTSLEKIALPSGGEIVMIFQQAPDVVDYAGTIVMSMVRGTSSHIAGVFRAPHVTRPHLNEATPLRLLENLAGRFGFMVQIGDRIS